jgi:hypothetical protein
MEEVEALEPQEEVEEQVEATTTEEAPIEPVIEEEAKPAVPAGVQKRIDQITRQRHEAERQVQELREQLAAVPTNQPAQASTAKPKLEDFDYDDAQYIDALTDWKVSNALDSRQKQAAERQQQETSRQTAQDFESKREQVIAAGIAEYPDFEAKTLYNAELVITQEMAELLTGSDAGRDVMYYLGNNPVESKRIAHLSPLQQAREMGKIEAGLTLKPVKRETTAPEPITPVGSAGSQSTSVDPAKDYKKWAKLRNEGKL